VDTGCDDCPLFTAVGVIGRRDVANARAALARADAHQATVFDCGDEEGNVDFIGLSRICKVDLSAESDATCRAVTAVFLRQLAASGAKYVDLTVDCHPGKYDAKYWREVDAGDNAELTRSDGTEWFLWLSSY
jgi:hypothetical protein